MSSRATVLVLAGLALLAAVCFVFVDVCGPAGTCVPSTLPMSAWLAVDGPLLEMIGAIALIAWLVRTAMLLHAVRGAMRVLATSVPPSRLLAAQARLGATRLVCLAGDRESAFCSGTWRPTIFVGEGLADRLSAEELDAVLLHELDHANRYEPVRRAARQAAADVFFFAPAVRWWAHRRMVQVELVADRRALERVGPRAVAAALWTLDASVPSVLAAFVGAAGPRVAQLLGDPPAQPGPPPRVIATSLAGTYLALQILACAAATLLYLK